MTAARKPTAQQVGRALETIARAFGPGWSVGEFTEAHVEFPAFNGGPVDTWRVWAKNGDRTVLLAHVPRAALEDGAP